MPRLHMDHRRAQHAGLANHLRKSRWVGWSFPAQIHAPASKLTPGTCQAIVPIMKDLLGGFFAECFLQRAHEGLVGFVDIRIILTVTEEVEGTAFSVNCFCRQPTIAIKLPVSVSDFPCQGVELCTLFGFH